MNILVIIVLKTIITVGFRFRGLFRGGYNYHFSLPIH